MFPSVEEAGVTHAFDFVQFLVNERKANPRTQFNVLAACVHVVRFLYHGESKVDRANPKAVPYSDLPVMAALKQLVSKAHKAVKKARGARAAAPLVADERLKWLEWDEFLGLVRELHGECADRQRTLRELQLGRTLVKEDGRWLIRHTAADYKTGKLYGQRPPLVIASFLYPELEAYINEFRAELNPSHDFLFTRVLGGGPLTDKALYDMFETELAWSLVFGVL
ncbi:hypothetical protein MNEG_4154 [Monoraphidium neglectum]|uniref:Uncharacterized protein n=1 Tax=Monoraphidium neglectum TaxID=145388 RepID=A0A0D2NF99_9CHLO|nr:hypothetical protein MNEG_4154 [Monoraphidium neglectum]KIZ03806.1 hypothetical protein MNEG_4154 [Monoraphidium neglectum]|eukprot:XP_013902825.1 hypothetical protein MNEG_4154 [Monoraphidium neglectum]